MLIFCDNCSLKILLKFFVRAKVFMYAAGSLQGIKIVIFVAVFHGVHSYYTILRIFAEEHYGHGRGVDEAAGVRVRYLGD